MNRNRLLRFLFVPLVVVAWAGSVLAQTATPTMTPAANSATRAFNLDSSAREAHDAKLGTRLLALWHGRQTGGAPTANATPTSVDIAAGSYMVNGVYVPTGVAVAATAVALPAGTTTTSVQFRKDTICVTVAGAYTVIVGAAKTTQALAVKPLCPGDQAEVAYLQIPNSFTAGTTAVTAGMIKQAATGAANAGPF